MFGRSDHAGFVVLDGVEVRRDDLITAARRFSARSVAVRKVHTLQAMYRMLPFCPESWEYLQDACSTCGQLQRWRHAWALDRCDACSIPLAESKGISVARPLRPALEPLARIVGPDRTLRCEALESLPSELKQLSPGAVLDLAYSLATICDPKLPIERPSRTNLRDQRRLAVALAAAWNVMLGWPMAFNELVQRTVAGARGNGKERAAKEHAARQRLVNFLQSRNRASKLPQIVRLMEQTVLAYGDGQGLPAAGNLLVKPAARRLGITEGEVSRDRDDGLLATRLGISNGRILLNFDATEIERLETARRTRLGTHAAGSRLGLPMYAIERLVACGLLHADDHPWLVARFGAPCITKSTVQLLQDRLTASASSRRSIAHKVDLATVMRGFGGGPKPWETIIDKLIHRQLRFCIIGEQVSTKTIYIGATDVARCRALPPGAGRKNFSQTDALEILNLLQKHSSALEALRTTSAPSGAWEIDGGKLIRAAKRYVSYSELVSRTGLYPRTIRDSLLNLGCHPPADLGWIRRSAMSRLRQLK